MNTYRSHLSNSYPLGEEERVAGTFPFYIVAEVASNKGELCEEMLLDFVGGLGETPLAAVL